MADKAEILQILKDDKALTAIAEEAFKKCDSDGNGYLDKEEVGALMKQANKDNPNVPEMTDADVDAMYQKLDKNKDGKIQVDEFKVLIKAVLQALVEE